MKCASILIKKNGKFRGIQRYKCVHCSTQFQLSKRKDLSLTRKKLWYEFCFQYATIDTLKGRYIKSEKWVRNQLSLYQLPERSVTPRAMVAIMDATKVGYEWLFVVRDLHAKENVYMAVVSSETTFCYQLAMQKLTQREFVISALVGDGKTRFPAVSAAGTL
ncbi:MAG: hypothetical protein UY07_C0017G0026 [Parcubacteria group bacterium GW2011_GWA1_47_8]|nr:hypothetical protein [uncultured bacterium]KKU81488.1 MAG: hypothetical protein UY07_C0017G0026 [Parcubacteria group bacterium GW2011_GWA1_47_8]